MIFNTFLIVHIGGASMSGLAEILYKSGKKVYGWEHRIHNENVQSLIKKGINVFSEKIPRDVLENIECVVHSSITSSDCIRTLFNLESDIPIFTQFRFIDLLIKDSKSIAVSGSYGKTITTTLLSHVLSACPLDVNFTCGGVSKNFNSNAKFGESNVWIVEAVETHENCLWLSYSYGILLNIESQSQISIFEKFIDNAKSIVFVNSDDNYCKEIINRHNNILTFGINSLDADLRAINISYLKDSLTFDTLWKEKVLGRIDIPYNGFFSIYNVLAVIAISIFFGNTIEFLNENLKTYLGVHRRFEFLFKSGNISFMLDIAHHPFSIKEVIKECKKEYNELLVLYRPHMYQELNMDAKVTIEAFVLADKVVLLDIESVKDKLDEGIDSEKFVNSLRIKDEKWDYFNTQDKLLDWLSTIQYSNTLIIQMGMYLDMELSKRILSIVKSY